MARRGVDKSPEEASMTPLFCGGSKERSLLRIKQPNARKIKKRFFLRECFSKTFKSKCFLRKESAFFGKETT